MIIPIYAKLLYFGFSILLLFYAVFRPKAAPFIFSWSIALNIFPFIFSPHYSQVEARFLGMPLSYMPMISATFGLIILNGLKFRRQDRVWFAVMVAFLGYILITTFLLREFSATSLVYFLGWPFNLFLFLVAANYFYRLESPGVAKKVIVKLVVILLLGCLIGLFRYFTDITYDANFLPFMNRGPVAILMIIVTPLMFYLHSIKYITTQLLILSWILIFITFLYLFTRIGLFAFIFSSVLYLFSISKKGKLIGVLILIGVFVVYLSGVADVMFNRFATMPDTLSRIQAGTMDGEAYDYRRFILVNAAIDIIKENFWLGTGVGLENYINELKRIVPNFATHYGKSHNFYLSYFAELGFIGFSMLLLLLVGVYRKVRQVLAMKIAFVTMAIFMMVSEYILFPELWFFFGMLAGMSAMIAKKVKIDA